MSASIRSSSGGVYSGYISHKVIHLLAQAGTENHIGNPNLSPSGINMCAHAHTETCTYKETPPSDTYRYPAAPQHTNAHDRQGATRGWRCTGLIVTQPHAMRHSPDHHPTHRDTWNPQTHAHTRTPLTPTPNTGTGLSTHMQ